MNSKTFSREKRMKSLKEDFGLFFGGCLFGTFAGVAINIVGIFIVALYLAGNPEIKIQDFPFTPWGIALMLFSYISGTLIRKKIDIAHPAFISCFGLSLNFGPLMFMWMMPTLLGELPLSSMTTVALCIWFVINSSTLVFFSFKSSISFTKSKNLEL